jgi:putative ABC transport system permease protein
MSRSFQELKHALRSVLKRRAFSAIIVLVLALGIGANTAIFSVVNAVLLRPLPFNEPDRLVQIWHVPPAKSFPGFTKFAVSPANFLDWQAQNHVLEAMATFQGSSFTFGSSGNPQPIAGAEVGPEFFSVLRTRPLLGRIFTKDDGKSGTGQLAVISESFWRTQLGANPNIIGTTLRLNDQPHTVVGVVPASFIFPVDNPAPQVWTCLQWDAKERAVRGDHNYHAIGRLKPGISLPQAQSQLSAIAHQLEQQYPADDAGWGVRIVPLREELVGDVRPALLVLLGAVAFVLLIACANVINLVLATTLARRKELAIRTALGATRGNLIRQVLLETVLLAIAGGALGIFFARFGVQLIVNFLSGELPRIHEIGLDTAVLLFTLILSVLTGLLAGLFPAWRFTKADVNEALKQGLGRTGSDSGTKSTRNILVVAEMALSLMLLVGAGLMVRTFYHLRRAETGIDPNRVLTMSIPLPKVKYAKPGQMRTFYNQALDKIRVLPGVESASVIDSLPLQGGSTQPVMIEGRPVHRWPTSRKCRSATSARNISRQCASQFCAGAIWPTTTPAGAPQ